MEKPKIENYPNVFSGYALVPNLHIVMPQTY